MTQTRSEASLRILQVVPAYYPAVRYGGPIRSVHGLAAALAQRGHDVHVYTTNIDHERNMDVPLNTPVDLDGVKVHYFRVPALRRLCWAPDLRRELRASIGTFDIVHLHSIFLWPTFVAAREATRRAIPYVMSPRGMLVRKLIHNKSRIAKTAWINLIERQSLAHAAALHVTTAVEATEIRALNLPQPPIFDIPNGLSWPKSPEPRDRGPFANLPAPYALFLSRISWKKGIDALIRAWQRVDNLHLVVAGNDEENYTPHLRTLAQSLGVDSRVHFIGPVDDRHKWSLYADATMYLLPSQNENFGNAVAEAMAMRCPVLLTADVGIASLVRQHSAGLIISTDPADIANAVNELSADAPRRRSLGDAGRQAVAQHLSWDSVAQRFEIMYRQMRAPPEARPSAAIAQRMLGT